MLSRWEVSAFLDDMPRRIEAADLVLARSGASTVAELAAAGKPALLVPFPQATDDHQRKNAEVMVAGGAARMLIQAEMSDEILLTTLVDLLRDGAGLEQMGIRAKALAKPDAAADIAAMVVGSGEGRLKSNSSEFCCRYTQNSQ